MNMSLAISMTSTVSLVGQDYCFNPLVSSHMMMKSILYLIDMFSLSNNGRKVLPKLLFSTVTYNIYYCFQVGHKGRINLVGDTARHIS